MRFEQIIKKHIGKIVVIKGRQLIDKSVICPPWQKQREKYLFNGTIKDENLREVLPGELIFEWDFPETISLEEGRKEAEKWAEKVKECFIMHGQYFRQTDHKGKSPHTRLYIDGLDELETPIRLEVKRQLAEEVLKEIGFHSEIVTLDWSLLTSEFKLVSLEGAVHWKDKWQGNKEEVLFENKIGKLSTIQPEIITEVKAELDKERTSNKSISPISADNVDTNILKKWFKDNYCSPHRNNCIMAFGGQCRRKGITQIEAETLLQPLMAECGESQYYEIAKKKLSYCFDESREVKNVAVWHFLKQSFGDAAQPIYDKLLSAFKDAPLQMPYFTEHLPMFKQIEMTLGLFGAGYILPKKAVWYQAISSALGAKPLNVGGLFTDTRLWAIYMLPSGRGKLNIKRFKESVAEWLERDITMPVSLHSEQLVGKTITKKTRIKNEETKRWNTVESRIANPGHLADAEVIFDEASALLTDETPEMDITRTYLTTAGDPYPHNTLVKRMVEDEREHTLKYAPQCNCTFFTQEVTIKAGVVRKGYLRRNLLVYPQLGNVQKSELKAKFEVSAQGQQEAETQLKAKLISINRSCKEKLPSITEEAQDAAVDVIADIVSFIRGSNKKAAPLADSFAFPLQGQLVKMAVMLAASYHHAEVRKEHMILAGLDLLEFIDSQCRCLDRMMLGTVGSGIMASLPHETQKIVSWLLEQGATSKQDSEVTSSAFVAYCAKTFGIKQRATYYRLSHEWQDLIHTAKVGKEGSAVWVDEDAQKELCKFCNKCNFIILKNYLSLNKSATPYNTILYTLQNLQNLQFLKNMNLKEAL